MKKIRSEIIAIGNEILAGWTLNTNSHWISQRLYEIGVTVEWMTTIADTEAEIIAALKLADTRADIILCTGGLGPTPDDITKSTIAGFFGSSLVTDEATLTHIKNLFAGRNLGMSPTNIKQAVVPDNAELIFNPIGTAPGLMFTKNEKLFFFMPGVPGEMKQMINSFILDIISARYQLDQLETFILRTTGIPESRLFEKLATVLNEGPDVPVSFLPKITGVDIKIRISRQPREVYQRVRTLCDQIRRIAGKYIYTETEQEMAQVLGNLLRTEHLTLSVAESFTGGSIASQITDVPGSSEYFQGALICYSNESKIKDLEVSAQTIQNYGAVSEETVREMLSGVRKMFQTDCAIATSGIAGPGGGTTAKPVGLAYVGALFRDKVLVKKFNFGKDRLINKDRGTMAGLESLRRLIL
ncbi:MAG: competence/damage-inducible protein A [Calditrichales bacterium]|nr:MAG: competence/damage-inducible protein A [Calditrichales bacterium]